MRNFLFALLFIAGFCVVLGGVGTPELSILQMLSTGALGFVMILIAMRLMRD
jgi:hypothetical protein